MKGGGGKSCLRGKKMLPKKRGGGRYSEKKGEWSANRWGQLHKPFYGWREMEEAISSWRDRDQPRKRKGKVGE